MAPVADASAGDRLADLRAELRDFLQSSRLGPDTLPLNEDMVDVLMPDQFEATPVPNFANDGGVETGIVALFRPDRYAYLEDDTVHLTFDIKRLAGASEGPIPVALQPVRVSLSEAEGPEELGTVDLTSVPGTNRWGGQVRPISLGLRDFAGHVIFNVLWSAPGYPMSSARATVQYTGTPPARFTGKVSDWLESGSLVLEVGVDVRRDGNYTIQGNLYSKLDDRPVAYTTFTGPLKTTDHVVRLEYYGLVFHDAGIPGPYVLRRLRGRKLPEGTQSGRGADLRTMELAYETKSYSLEEFTSAEWTSPLKQSQIAALEREIAAAEGRVVPAPSFDPPAPEIPDGALQPPAPSDFVPQVPPPDFRPPESPTPVPTRRTP